MKILFHFKKDTMSVDKMDEREAQKTHLQSLGYNHVLTDNEISFTPYPWIEEIKKSAKKFHLLHKRLEPILTE